MIIMFMIISVFVTIVALAVFVKSFKVANFKPPSFRRSANENGEYRELRAKEFKLAVTSATISKPASVGAMSRLLRSAQVELDHIQTDELSSRSALLLALFETYSALDWATVAASEDPDAHYSSAEIIRDNNYGSDFYDKLQSLRSDSVRVIVKPKKEVKITKLHHLWSVLKQRGLQKMHLVRDSALDGSAVQVGKVLISLNDIKAFVAKALDLVESIS